MKRFLNVHFMVSVHLIFVALIITIATWGVHNAKNDIRINLEKNIERQLNEIVGLADITDRNGADAVVSKIITDCPKREEFEVLLMKLNVLSHRDLLEVQKLFESCGSFYSERKALMVSRLEREFEVLTDNVFLHNSLDDNEQDSYNLESWGRLVSFEKKRSDFLSEQTDIQKEIIIELIKGSEINSKNIVDLTSRAQGIAESLGVINKQIDELRDALTT